MNVRRLIDRTATGRMRTHTPCQRVGVALCGCVYITSSTCMMSLTTSTFAPFTSQATFAISNGTSGVDPACKARVGESAALQCLLAENVAPHLKTPLFALQAQYDAWQLGNILELRDPTGAPAMPHLRGPLTPACAASASCLAGIPGVQGFGVVEVPASD